MKSLGDKGAISTRGNTTSRRRARFNLTRVWSDTDTHRDIWHSVHLLSYWGLKVWPPLHTLGSSLNQQWPLRYSDAFKCFGHAGLFQFSKYQYDLKKCQSSWLREEWHSLVVSQTSQTSSEYRPSLGHPLLMEIDRTVGTYLKPIWMRGKKLTGIWRRRDSNIYEMPRRLKIQSPL